MKPSDHIGIGSGKCISLYCEVQEITPDYLKFWVINGGWEGSLRGDEIEVFATDMRYKGNRILYAGPIPQGFDYNEAIEFMEKQLSRWWIVRKWHEYSLATHVRIERRTARLKNACKAFMLVWKGEQVHTDFDDSIPF